MMRARNPPSANHRTRSRARNGSGSWSWTTAGGVLPPCTVVRGNVHPASNSTGVSPTLTTPWLSAGAARFPVARGAG